MSSDSKRTSNEELLQLAIRAAKSGQRDSAKMMFGQVLQRNRKNETAMMWMAKLANSESERQEWLVRILEHNPDNGAAQKALEKMSYNRAASNNRTIMMFGAVVAVLFLLLIVVVLIVLAS